MKRDYIDYYCKTCGVKFTIKEVSDRIRKYCSIRCSKIGKANCMWEGDNVGYKALHAYIRRVFLKPTECSLCNKKTNKLDLANISNTYKRDILDWEWLCRSCHMIKDGRLLILHESQRTLVDIKCLQCSAIFKPKLWRSKFCCQSCASKYSNKRRYLKK